METSVSVRSTQGTRFNAFRLRALALFALCVRCVGVQVDIDYSFALPAEFGVATLDSANCCPHGILPENVTDGFAAPSIYGIGVQKGGTTTLFSYLKTHRQLFSAAKEMHYFDRFNITTSSYSKYLSRWSANREIKKLGDKNEEDKKENPVLPNGGRLFEISPSYLLVPFAACRAKHFTPTAKFIVLLREPVSRTYSGLNHALRSYRQLPEEYRPRWAQKTFLDMVKEGMQLVKNDPNCDFTSGRGTKTYNDCFKCVMMFEPRSAVCEHQTFVQATDNNLGFSCTTMSKSIILRSMYAAQLAWWFTLHSPSQFKIVNSEDFFKNSNQVLHDIVDFLGLDRQYTTEMFTEEAKVENRGVFNEALPLQVEHAKSLLHEFYARPNLELYRLLHETGHRDFTPFESYLKHQNYVDCKDIRNIETELCGNTKTREPEIRIKTNPTLIKFGPGDNTTMTVHFYRRTTQIQKFSALSDSEYTTHTIISGVLVILSLYTLLYLRSRR